MKRHFHSLLLLGASIALLPVVAHAQPDPNNAPMIKEIPRQNVVPNITIKRGIFPGVVQQDTFDFNYKPLTEEQIKQMQAGQEERRLLSLRQKLTQAGFTEATIQDPIVAFAKDREAARVKLRAQWQKLNDTTQKADMPDAQVAAFLNDYQDAMEEEKARYETASKQLGEKIGLAQKPRLEILLISLGILGDEAAIMNPVAPVTVYALPALEGETARLIPNGGDVRLQTPIGPIRLDVARPGGGTHFSIGPTF